MAIDEAKIRERAEKLWRESGAPAGRDAEFWEKAEKQLELEEQNTPRQPDRGPPTR
jgi:hypothetical protein